MSGWVKIHRDIINNPFWTTEKFSRGQAWIDLILLAQFQPGFFHKRGIKINYNRGDVTISERGLADRWGWSRSKVHKYLEDIEQENRIKPQNLGVTTLISIVNYEEYQGKEPQTDHKRATKEPQKDLYKESKEGKEIHTSKARPKNFEEVLSYFLDKGSDQNEAERWHDHQQAIGWVYGKSRHPVKDWKSSARTWIKNAEQYERERKSTGNDNRKQSAGEAILNWGSNR